ncbi:MAG: Smr/MutS family protein [Pseudomonadota bacterium]
MSGRGRSRRGPRDLAPEERFLWDQVARTTQRLETGQSKQQDNSTDKDLAKLTALPKLDKSAENHDAKMRVPDEMIRMLRPDTSHRKKQANVTVDWRDAEVGPVGRPEAGLDRRTAERLRKGAREPDARIDLHGMTAERAHRACLRFLADSLSRGARVVLVITGKGRVSDDGDFMNRGRGILRESLPGWLKSSPLGHSIVGIYEANQKHGGAGAFYVYLKRRR